MYELRREARLLGTTSERSVVSWLDRGIRLYLVEARDLTVDSRLLKQVVGVPGGRRVAQVSFQLSGALTTLRHRSEAVIRDGYFGIEPSLEWAELWQGRSFRTLVLEWSSSWGSVPTGFSLARMDASMASAAQAAAGAIKQRRRREVVEALGALYSRLRAFGLDLEEWSANRLTVPSPKHVEVSRVLNELRTNLPGQAGWNDGSSATGRSERQLRRDMKGFYRSLDIDAPSLRALLRRERLLSAVSLLSSSVPSVERTARSVGYGSSRAFAFALRSAGLPSASVIVDLARQARD